MSLIQFWLLSQVRGTAPTLPAGLVWGAPSCYLNRCNRACDPSARSVICCYHTVGFVIIRKKKTKTPQKNHHQQQNKLQKTDWIFLNVKEAFQNPRSQRRQCKASCLQPAVLSGPPAHSWARTQLELTLGSKIKQYRYKRLFFLS